MPAHTPPTPSTAGYRTGASERSTGLFFAPRTWRNERLSGPVVVGPRWVLLAPRPFGPVAMRQLGRAWRAPLPAHEREELVAAQMRECSPDLITESLDAAARLEPSPDGLLVRAQDRAVLLAVLLGVSDRVRAVRYLAAREEEREFVDPGPHGFVLWTDGSNMTVATFATVFGLVAILLAVAAVVAGTDPTPRRHGVGAETGQGAVAPDRIGTTYRGPGARLAGLGVRDAASG